jgi:toxin ParE1/3/4
MQVVFSPEAIEDLRHIRRYIAQDNPAAASRVAVQLVATCDRLNFMPYRGRPGPVPGMRELVSVRPYVIVCRVGAEIVEIVRIWHTAQSRR